MKNNILTRTASSLYRFEVIRRYVKDSPEFWFIPKIFFNLFWRNSSFPRYINFEITNICNFACPMCPDSLIPKENRGSMSLDLFKKIMAEIDRYGSLNLHFVKMGEAFLHPEVSEFFRVIRRAKNRHRVMWVTNGSPLNPENIQWLIDYEIDELNISIESLNPETFTRARGYDLKELLDKISLLQKIKRTARSRFPIISVNTVISKDNLAELSAMRDYFKSRGIRQTTQKYNRTFTNADLGAENWTLDRTNASSPHRYPCAHVFTNIAVNYDGTASLCCADWNYAYIVGDLKRQTISEIWNSERYRDIRRAQLNGKYGDPPVCADCPNWQSHPDIFFRWQYKGYSR